MNRRTPAFAALRLAFAAPVALSLPLILDAGPALAQATQNLFISPCGQPFYAPLSDPYPVVAWFKQADKNGDGRIDPDEFRADAQAFFNVLDKDHNGILSSGEIYIYEHQMVPAILNRGVSSLDAHRLLVRVQLTSPGDFQQQFPNVTVDPEQSRANHSADGTPDPEPSTAIKEGAAYFSIFNEPEPVMAADRNFDFRISLKEFLDQSDRHFAMLDVKNKGYLELTDIPKTSAEVFAKAKRAAK